MRTNVLDEVTSTSSEQRELKVKARVRCVTGKYRGWEGVVKKLTAKTVTFAPDYRHDKEEIQRTFPRTSVEVRNVEQEQVLPLQMLMQTLSLYGNQISRKEWLEWSDAVERAFDKQV